MQPLAARAAAAGAPPSWAALAGAQGGRAGSAGRCVAGRLLGGSGRELPCCLSQPAGVSASSQL